MRKTRLLLSLVLMVGPASAGVTACGGDDSGGISSGGTPDGSTDGSNNNGDSGNPSDAGSDTATGPQAKAAAVAAYLGQVVNLDGSASTGPAGFTYAWTVGAVPPGSTITTASLTGANTAKPSFFPDRPGAYSLTLTITAGAAQSTANAVATVVDPPVFYFNTENDASAGFEATLKVVGAGTGDTGTAVGCFARDAGGSYDTLARNVAMAGADWWEAPAGQPSRAVFVFETREDGGATTVLAATTSAATCATPPTKLVAFPGDPATRTIEQPQISPNGNRVAYFRKDDQGVRVATIGFDGTNGRSLAPLAAFPDGGPNPEAGAPGGIGARPVWVNDTTVAWLQELDNDNWQIVTANDAANATPTLLMSCTGQAPNQFDILANGEVIVSQLTGNGAAAVTNILVYPITAATKACGAARNISLLTSTNQSSFARDFALSPDKSRVAYHTNDDSTSKQELVVARVDGATAPVSIAAPLTGANRGPRWVGGGAYITWGINAAQFDAGLVGNAVAVVAADGGAARAAAAAPSTGTTYSIGNGFFSCSFAPAVGSGVSLFGIAGILALRLVRRRRRH